MPWHQNSIFGDGPRRRLDRNQRAAFKFILIAHYNADRLTPKEEKVGHALLRCLSASGRCDPSYARLGEMANCDEKTARTACQWLRNLGMLSWVNRIVREGKRTRQTSNAYILVPFLTDGNFSRETRRKDINRERPKLEPVDKCRLDVAPEVRHASQQALAGIARLRERALGFALSGSLL